MNVETVIFVSFGILCIVCALAAWKWPAFILLSYPGFWINLIGERNTIRFGRYVGAPLGIILGAMSIYLGVAGR